MKNVCIFAVFRPRTKDILRLAAIFMPTAKILGCCLLVGCCFLKVSTVLGRTSEGNSLLNYSTNIFQHEMTKNMKNASRLSNTPQSTPTERNTVTYSDYLIEKNAKNKAYFFILSHGLLDYFAAFCQTYRSADPDRDCVNFLISKI